MDPNFEEPDLETLRNLMCGLQPSGEPEAVPIQRTRGGIVQSGQCLLVLDASFNPMTLAHERMVLDGSTACGANEILLMLSRANVDKEVFGADLGQRLRMLLHYSAFQKECSIFGCSHARFVDKALALVPHYPTDTRIEFVMGFDTLERLVDRQYYTDMDRDLDVLFGLARVLVANRDENGKGAIQARLDTPDLKRYRDRIDIIEIPKVMRSVSSSQVRSRVAKGLSIKALVPTSILDSIDRMGLYKS